MKVLGIDTSTMTTSLALVEEEKIIGEFSVTGEIRHSERVMEMLHELFAKHNISPKELDLLVGGIGPGSFTGLRIGITIIKTLAQVLHKEALGISTLRALAHSYPTDSLVVPIIDARRDRVYTGIYQWNGEKLNNVMEDTVLPMIDLLEILEEKKAVILGPGVETFEEKIKKRPTLTIAPPWYHQVRSVHHCFIGQIDYNDGLRQHVYHIIPNYVKKSQAEREWEKKHVNQSEKSSIKRY